MATILEAQKRVAAAPRTISTLIERRPRKYLQVMRFVAAERACERTMGDFLQRLSEGLPGSKSEAVEVDPETAETLRNLAYVE